MADEREIKLTPGKFGHPPAKTTCKECPLRKDSERGLLGGWTPTMYIRGMFGVADFACHMSKGFLPGDLDAMRSCTGVAHFRCNTGVVNDLPLGNARTAALSAGPNTTDVFETAVDFYRHHATKK